MEIKKNDPLRKMKQELLGGNPVNTYLTTVPSNKDLSMFRIALFDEREDIQKLENLKGSYIAYDSKVPPFSIRNERNVMK